MPPPAPSPPPHPPPPPLYRKVGSGWCRSRGEGFTPGRARFGVGREAECRRWCDAAA
eukprot:gene55172-47743_t